MIIRLFKSVLS